MELSLFLAQLLGAYALVLGLIFITKRSSLMRAVAEFSKSRALTFAVGGLELAAGLAIVISHSIFTPDFRGLITLIGYLMVLEGALYLFLPQRTLRGLLSSFNKPALYTITGLITLLVGVYLAGVGFGMW